MDENEGQKALNMKPSAVYSLVEEGREVIKKAMETGGKVSVNIISEGGDRA